jgi:hypothetical protein
LPEEVWAKIDDFQKKGATSNLQSMIEALAALKANNAGLIESMK